MQNGVGYDTYMNTIESALSPNSSRKVIDVQQLLGLPNSTSNPHLWYKGGDDAGGRQGAGQRVLGARAPSAARTSRPTPRSSTPRSQPWYAAVRAFAAKSPHTPVATTEPVGDYMLEAAGTDNLTPFPLQADIMNGVDPAPQAVQLPGRRCSRSTR